MAVIDVLTVVDAGRILKVLGRNNFAQTGQYKQLPDEGRWWVYMFATWYDVKGESYSELDVFAQAGDTIRWRMTTTSAGTGYQAFIQDVPVTRGEQYITKPQMKYEIIKAPQLDTTVLPPGRPMIQKVEDSYWEVNVLRPGPVTYHLNFTLCGLGPGGGGGGGDGDGDSDCNCSDNYGGYTYDPFINTKE